MLHKQETGDAIHYVVQVMRRNRDAICSLAGNQNKSLYTQKIR
jgi:hypothetical protein